MTVKFTRFIYFIIGFLSLSVNYSLAQLPTGYCKPGAQMACFYGEKITRVNLESLNHFDDVCTTDSEGYKDFSSSITAPVLTAGKAYTLTVSKEDNFAGLGYVRVWIDFNRNGVLEAGESIGQQSGYANAQLQFTFNVPANASIGKTKMRLMLRRTNTLLDTDACHSYGSYRGQTKDYAVEITSPAGCNPIKLPLTEGFNSTSMPNCWSAQYVKTTTNGTNAAFVFTSSAMPNSSPSNPAAAEGSHYVFWNSYNFTNGATSRLVTPMIDAASDKDIDVSFMWLYNSFGKWEPNDSLVVQYSFDAVNWKSVQSFSRFKAMSNTYQWTKETVRLPADANNKTVLYVGFLFKTSTNEPYNCAFDAVDIKAANSSTNSCGTPTSLQISEITTATALAKWAATTTGTVKGYEYVLSTSATFPTTYKSDTTTNLSALLSALKSNTQYYLFIRTLCTDNTSSWISTSFVAALAPGDCAIPSNPFANNITTSSATINWTSANPVPASGYQVYYSKTNTAPATGTAVSNTTTSINQLEPNTTYYVFIRSNCGSGIFSNWLSFAFTTSPIPVVCNSPSVISFTNITSTSGVASWSDPNTSKTEAYEYYITTNPNATTGFEILRTTSTSVSFNDLNTNTTYYVFVRSVCNTATKSSFRNNYFTTNLKGTDPKGGLYPNPTNGPLTFMSEDPNLLGKTFVIYDIVGRKLMEKQITALPYNFDVSMLPSGTYVLKLRAQTSIKFVVIRD